MAKQAETSGAEGKRLVKDVMIYGVSSIIGRFFHFLLVPLYSHKMSVEGGSYGVVTNMYALTALLLVILTYGMETGFFYFSNKKGEDPKRVFSTILMSVGFSSLLFIFLCLLNLTGISKGLGYSEHPEYLGLMIVVVALDAFLSILFAYLRYSKRPVKFASIKILSILTNILLNIFFIIVVPFLAGYYPSLFEWFDGNQLEKYVFISNLIAVLVQFIFFVPELKQLKYVFDYPLFKRIMKYSFPMLILGVAGILSQTIDKIIFPIVYPGEAEGMSQLSIYGATSKIAMIMGLSTQAFRYAYEPFVFSKNREGDGRKTYADVMKFFIIFTLLGFLGVVFYLDLIQYLIQSEYRVGLVVVPIIMITEILIGVYFNLSYWYKLTEQTKWGAYFSMIGCAVIIALNVLWIPKYSYIGSAYAGLVGYAIMTLLSYVVGLVKNPIPYDLKRIASYIILSIVLYFVGTEIEISNIYLRLAYRTVLLMLYLAYVVKMDLPVSKIPYISRLLKK